MSVVCCPTCGEVCRGCYSAMHKAAPSDVRKDFGDVIRAYLGSFGVSPSIESMTAKTIVLSLKVWPWLADQIPDDVMRMAQRSAAGLPPVA